MRKLFVAGNWKMNLDLASARALASGLGDNLCGCTQKAVDVAVCPPFVYIPAVVDAIKGGAIAVGAQDVYFEDNGAYTGEISVAMLKDVGCGFVLVGHSERRHVLKESDEIVNKKLLAALAGGLDVILCIGELLEEREANQTEAVIERHVRSGLAGVTKEQMAHVTLAYEPVWAIGTGKTATPEQAQEAHAFTRGIVADMFGAEVAQAVRIQYGGSVKASNAAELLGKPDVDGALVGGASLKVEDFLGIINAAVGGCC